MSGDIKTIIIMVFYYSFQAEGPPVQMEPVDLSVKTPVVLQVPRYPPQRLKNPAPTVKISTTPPGKSNSYLSYVFGFI